MLPLKFGFDFDDLNSLSGLTKLDESFLQYVSDQNINLYNKLIFYRAIKQVYISPTDYSQFLIQLALLFDDFIAELFIIEQENIKLKLEHKKFDVIYECRRKFIQRYAIKKYPKEKIQLLDFETICCDLKQLIKDINELNIANHYIKWQTDSIFYEKELDILAKYCACMVDMNSSLMLFDIPRPINDNNHIREHKIAQLKESPYLGFNYRDKQNSAYSHSKYCIYCHNQEKDSCSKGLTEDKIGCPLKQKISEMNLLKSEGFNIGALAVTIIDNPMVAVTGHRICNDCMKSCIFQKQDPVNIPLIESDILSCVLQLKWGVEIYLLLTKWNPLNIEHPLPLKSSNYNILITGLGPSGFALAHYMLNEGHNVTAIDGLKITQLPFDETKPIQYWSQIKQSLETRAPQGFGGVAEYGITNRWDKNNLSLVRLILQRRSNFNMYGGIRLGSNITTNQAFSLGFDHIALCIGAGKPKFDNISNYFAKGVRIAADFLMNLQQGGAFISGSNANLQIRMPAIIIGCGLTAIDSAVELMHYYPFHVKQFHKSWEDGAINESVLNEEEKIIAQEYIDHAKLFKSAINDEDKIKIMSELGGINICYRSSLQQSPAYRLNHEEIEHALAISINFREYISPASIEVDQFNHVRQVTFSTGEILKAKTVLIAIGTENNKFDSVDERISHFGDCNLKYAGSVVKALASVKDNYKSISKLLKKQLPNKLSLIEFKSIIRSVNYLTEDIVEIIVYSPFAALNFHPGHFFKLQNYASNIEDVMEPLALTGIECNKIEETITFAIKAVGKTSKIAFNLASNDEIMLMGPTGSPAIIHQYKKVALLADNINVAGIIALSKALKENHCEVIIFAYYSNSSDRIYYDKITLVSDQVIWSCVDKELFKSRLEDISIQGSLLDSIKLAKSISNLDQVICSLNPQLGQIIAEQKNYLFPNVEVSINIFSQMQCMMKGICGQCIQKINDSQKYIFACACQNQNIENIDFDSYRQRLKQNSLIEKVRF